MGLLLLLILLRSNVSNNFYSYLCFYYDFCSSYHYYFRASMIWIIGEYAERIDNADELLESFLDNFNHENSQVRLLL